VVARKASIHVVSHDDNLLKNVATASYLHKVNLNFLVLDPRFSGNQLAENRFLLTDKLLEGDAPIVGFVSARWDERFPKWPSLGELDKIFEPLQVSQRAFFGPQTILASGRQVRNWIKSQDYVHPGMSTLLLEVLDATGRNNLSENTIRPITMGNNFIISREVAFEFMSYWRKSFSYLNAKYGFDFPFSYRCAKCGYTNPEGVGRWSQTRHAGFAYERVSALFFATHPELVALRPVGRKIRRLRRGYLPYLFKFGPVVYQILYSLRLLLSSCKHQHKALGR
jgi:hypothetical protein